MWLVLFFCFLAGAAKPAFLLSNTNSHEEDLPKEPVFMAVGERRQRARSDLDESTLPRGCRFGCSPRK